jgi:pyridoxal phosphate enzyme (YggS family)
MEPNYGQTGMSDLLNTIARIGRTGILACSPRVRQECLTYLFLSVISHSSSVITFLFNCFFIKRIYYCIFNLMSTIAENLKRLEERIQKAASISGRKREDIILIAVTKNVEPERIIEGIDAGIKIIGENRIQEAQEKFKFIKKNVEKHLVGHLQTNKVKKALELFDLIQSVDSLHLAQEISRRSKEKEKTAEILIEVNTSGEPSKYGVQPEEVSDLVEEIFKLENVKIKGLMTVGLFTEEIEKVRPCFVKLRSLYESLKSLKKENVEMKYLSMGMSSDFEVAIEEGANMIRIGTAIFGSRR